MQSLNHEITLKREITHLDTQDVWAAMVDNDLKSTPRT